MAELLSKLPMSAWVVLVAVATVTIPTGLVLVWMLLDDRARSKRKEDRSL